MGLMSPSSKPLRVGFLLFAGFELLDAAGPMEVLGRDPSRMTVTTFAADPGPVQSAQGVAIMAVHGFDDCPNLDVIVVPGGIGTRTQVNSARLLSEIRARCEAASIVFSVCTGAALLAKAGVLDGRRATSNKLAFDWVKSISDEVRWEPHARWVEDDRFITSSGVAAGIDAAFAILRRLFGAAYSEQIAVSIEYQPSLDASDDPFARA